MPPLPTEAAPLGVCRQCGSALPAPTGRPLFVHGVGAVGHQVCPVCGARWRYLWQERAPERARRSGWRFVVAGVAVLTIGVIVGLAIARLSTPSKTTPNSPAVDGPTGPATSVADDLAGAEFARITVPSNMAVRALMQYLASTNAATLQSELDSHVVAFEEIVGAMDKALAKARWPAKTGLDVQKLIAANEDFLLQIDLVRFGLRDSGFFTQKLPADAQVVRRAGNLVRRDLGLPPVL